MQLRMARSLQHTEERLGTSTQPHPSRRRTPTTPSTPLTQETTTMSRYHKRLGYRGNNVNIMRQQVWNQYPHICHICNKDIPTIKDMEVDHLTPLAHGGDPLDIAGVRPAHRYCNRARGTKPITEVKPKPETSREW